MRRSDGFNRAQAAVVEAAILVSRLHMLPRRQDRSGDRLSADRHGQDGRPRRELEAWGWLTEKIRAYYENEDARTP